MSNHQKPVDEYFGYRYFPSNRLRLKVCSIDSDYKICSILNDSASVLGENIQHMSTETGEYEWVDQHQSVMEDRTLLERLKQGIAEGTLDPASKDFSDEFRDLVPPEVWEQSAGILPLGKILELGKSFSQASQCVNHC